jgi:F-type H+-transporting ATPase subunit delta
LAEQHDIVSGMAGRYALALFSLARDARETDAVAAALRSFDAMIEASPDLQRLVRSPAFSARDQLKALSAILERAGVSGVAANFIKLVAAKRRLFAIRDMIAGYGKLDDAYRGVTRAEVVSAAPLGEANVEALKQALRAACGGKDVELIAKVDPSIIGGLVVKIGSRMVDGSLKTKLNAIRIRMKEVG